MIGSVGQAAAAPIGDVDAVFERVFTDGLGEQPSYGSVELSGEAIGLGTAAGECVGDDDLGLSAGSIYAADGAKPSSLLGDD